MRWRKPRVVCPVASCFSLVRTMRVPTPRPFGHSPSSSFGQTPGPKPVADQRRGELVARRVEQPVLGHPQILVGGMLRTDVRRRGVLGERLDYQPRYPVLPQLVGEPIFLQWRYAQRHEQVRHDRRAAVAFAVVDRQVRTHRGGRQAQTQGGAPMRSLPLMPVFLRRVVLAEVAVVVIVRGRHRHVAVQALGWHAGPPGRPANRLAVELLGLGLRSHACTVPRLLRRGVACVPGAPSSYAIHPPQPSAAIIRRVRKDVWTDAPGEVGRNLRRGERPRHLERTRPCSG